MEPPPKEGLTELPFWEKLKKQLPFITSVIASPGSDVAKQDEEFIQLPAVNDINDNNISDFEESDQNPASHHIYERLRLKNKISVTSKEELTAVYTKLSATNKELRKRDAEIAYLKDELGKANAQLEQLTFISSHDLQEPLRKIQVFSDLLLSSESGLNEQARKYSDKISISAARMSALVKDLFNFSLLNKKSDKKSVKVDLNEIVKNVLPDFTEIIAAKKATINYSLPGSIYGEPFQLNRLFHHIISNALKFDKGGLIITIDGREDTPEDYKKYSKLDKTKRYMVIRIGDNGIGFNQRYSGKIFVLFQRLNYESTITGTGTGLSIARRIVENHNGFIFAQGRENEGATFTIFLPVTPAPFLSE